MPRSIKILTVASRYLIFYKLTSARNKSFGWRLRQALGELGLTFIKIGQILSMRYDLLSRSDCLELQQLLDNVNPLPWTTIKKILSDNYQQPLPEIFSYINETPLASASVSQVHYGVLVTGEEVAVKVKRPQVDALIKKDLSLMRHFAKLGQSFSKTLKKAGLVKLVNYFEASLANDINFLQEADNLEKIYQQYEFCREEKIRSDLGTGVFPLPYRQWSSNQIIVMTFIKGVSLNQTDKIKDNPAYDIRKSLKTYVNVGFRNLFSAEEYFFQSDPHLSNILVLPDGNASTVDCGLIAVFTKEQTILVRRCMIAVYVQDLAETMKYLFEMSGVDYQTWEPVVRDDMAVYIERARQEGMGFWLMEVARIFARHGLEFPEFLFAYGRSCLVMDGVIKTFFNNQTTLDILGEEFKRAAILQAISDLKDKDWVPLLYAFSKALKETPDFIADALNDPAAAWLKIRRIFT
jgi:ubiquinone biosynthesis protein